ncbi:Fanconi anemia group G protein isoform X3 [Corvus cornix cornix]|uniref:Fanconi anemia group G protein isoform X3 n=1 Tax=Corvus cornix cornix TaxID=932674 RepID=UPI0019505DF5|nr:Fanconi anemia group G protein isoform X3 [Corvus cornix cornix]
MAAAMKRRRGTEPGPEPEPEPERGCLRAWAAHSRVLVGRWTMARCGGEARRARRQQRDEFGELLRRIRGLPAALPALPLELTVLYNSLLFTVGASDSAIKREAEGIREGLLRVLEACGACGQDLGTEELWQKVLQEEPGRSHCSEGQNKLLSLIKAWRVPPEGASLPLVQSAKDLKEILCTTAAFLQGLQELEAGNFPTALSLLQEAAGGFCSKKILAQIYTCLGCCAQRMGKPQTALQHLKRALQIDFQCLPALSHAAAVYHELGETDVELQALTLLYEALGKNPPAAASSSPYFLMQTELLVHTPVLASLLRHHHPSEVKYLLAQRCLQDGRVAGAVEHYLDFLSLLQGGLQQQVPLDGSSAVPRIPEVFLEAASALGQSGRHQDAITVCEEVISRTTDLIPRVLRVEARLEQPECSSPGAELAGGLLSQKKESLCCLAWRAAGYLHQGWAWAKLGESKEAVTQFSRCLNDLLRLQLHGSGVKPTENIPAEVEVLQKIRLLSLIGRGTQFLELGKHKEALLDFQHSLQISPGDPAATSYLVQALWKLNRKQEAAAQWQKLSQSSPEEDGQQQGQGRPLPLYLVSCLEQAMFPHSEPLARSIQDYLGTAAQDTSS